MFMVLVSINDNNLVAFLKKYYFIFFYFFIFLFLLVILQG